MNNKRLQPLDVNILRSKKSKIVSSKEALKDVTPFEWSKEVLIGGKKVTISKSINCH